MIKVCAKHGAVLPDSPAKEKKKRRNDELDSTRYLFSRLIHESRSNEEKQQAIKDSFSSQKLFPYQFRHNKSGKRFTSGFVMFYSKARVSSSALCILIAIVSAFAKEARLDCKVESRSA
jgi:hypothetical protein